MHLVGTDIGFSQRRRTNAIAIFEGNHLVRTDLLSVDERNKTLRSLKDVDVVAIDAPILPPGTPLTLERHCERVFSRGAFQKRCKPGMSHIRGTGQRLREHGRQAAEHLLIGNAVRTPASIVEAFPNAFLGVAVPNEHFMNPPKIKRGGKFDWLYDRWRDERLFARVVGAAGLAFAPF